MKLVPSKLVSERDSIRRHFADGELTSNLAGVAVAADIDQSVGVADGVKTIEHRHEHPMIPKPSVKDHNLRRAVAYR